MVNPRFPTMFLNKWRCRQGIVDVIEVEATGEVPGLAWSGLVWGGGGSSLRLPAKVINFIG